MNDGEISGRLDEATRYPCSRCGALLLFEAGTSELRCPYCGFASPIPQSTDPVPERDYKALLEAAESAAPAADRAFVQCGQCGARTETVGRETAGVCPFCRAPMVHAQHAARVLTPGALLPFGISRAQALERYRSWIRGLWFAPGSLKRHAGLDAALSGVYLPYWTYDAMTHTQYEGERGERHYILESYSVRIHGRSELRTRQVPRVRWHPVQGQVARRFDDLLVPACRRLPQAHLNLLEPWDLAGLRPYADEYLSGFRAEAYDVSLQEGFAAARDRMRPCIESEVRGAIGGDEQRVWASRTGYSEITFKHILLPVWMSAFRFREKVYRVFVNARSGEVRGDRPYSAWKISAAVFAVILVLAVIALLRSL